MIRLIVFDLDGTLIDSRRDIADSINELLGTYHAAPLPLERVLTMVGEGARLLIQRALTAQNVDPSLDEAHARFLEIYDRRLVDHTRLYDGVLDLLQAFGGDASGAPAGEPRTGLPVAAADAPGASGLGGGRGTRDAAGDDRAQLAVLTNKPGAPARRIIEHLGIADRFLAIVGGDSPLPRKPDPQALLALCAQTGAAPEETLMVGDSWVDVQTARNAGTHACFVTFGFGEPPAEGLMPGEWTIDHAVQLLEVVARLNEVDANAPA